MLNNYFPLQIYSYLYYINDDDDDDDNNHSKLLNVQIKMLGVVSKLMVFRTISSNFVWILGKNIHNWRVKPSFSRMSTTICLCWPFLFQFLLYVRFKKTSNVLNLVPSEHVPQVNVQIHIVVVVLKNTKCSKHIREVAKVVPAAHVLNPLSLGTRSVAQQGLS